MQDKIEEKTPQISGPSHNVAPPYHELPFWTRMGFTPESFKRRPPLNDSNNLNQTLKRNGFLPGSLNNQKGSLTFGTEKPDTCI